MVRIPYEQIIDAIKKKTSISDEELDSRIQSKLDALSGLISKEGAAHILANELGINLLERNSGRMKVSNLFGGIRNVDVVAKVIAVYEVKEFATAKASGKVASMIVADETGSTRLTLWNDQTSLLREIKVGDVVLLQNVYTKSNQNRVELHVGSAGKLVVNPLGESVAVDPNKGILRSDVRRKRVSDLLDTDSNVELFATVVQSFDPRFYEVCPECGKRMRMGESVFACEAHGAVSPSFGYVLNVVLDDGSGNVRAVFFRDQILKLLEKSAEEFLLCKDNSDLLGDVKNFLLGSTIIVTGRVNKNSVFDRLEFVVSQVNAHPDVKKEIEQLSQSS